MREYNNMVMAHEDGQRGEGSMGLKHDLQKK